MRTITIKIEEDLLKELDEYAERHGLYRAEVIRLAIREFLRPNTTTYKS
jgi:metal-responsive CopG/Arc/MetJ family transcriptional regulator